MHTALDVIQTASVPMINTLLRAPLMLSYLSGCKIARSVAGDFEEGFHGFVESVAGGASNGHAWVASNNVDGVGLLSAALGGSSSDIEVFKLNEVELEVDCRESATWSQQKARHEKDIGRT